MGKKYTEKEMEIIEIAKAYEKIGELYFKTDYIVLQRKSLVEEYKLEAKKHLNKIPKKLHLSLEKIARLNYLLNKK